MPEQRRKLELQLNQPSENFELLYDNPIIGYSQFGEYYLYNLKGENEEFRFFAPAEVHEKMKDLKKGDKVKFTKYAEQKGSKIVTRYDLLVTPQNIKNDSDQSEPLQQTKDNYFSTMLSSYEDALKIQEKLNSMVDVNRIAITLFIARSKLNNLQEAK